MENIIACMKNRLLVDALYCILCIFDYHTRARDNKYKYTHAQAHTNNQMWRHYDGLHQPSLFTSNQIIHTSVAYIEAE